MFMIDGGFPLYMYIVVINSGLLLKKSLSRSTVVLNKKHNVVL